MDSKLVSIRLSREDQLSIKRICERNKIPFSITKGIRLAIGISSGDRLPNDAIEKIRQLEDRISKIESRKNLKNQETNDALPSDVDEKKLEGYLSTFSKKGITEARALIFFGISEGISTGIIASVLESKGFTNDKGNQTTKKNWACNYISRIRKELKNEA